jgi:hypothetical protein
VKKPTKKPQRVTQYSGLLMAYTDYTPDDLRKIADDMEQRNIISIEIESGGWESCIEIYETSLETPEQAEIRYQQEMKVYQKHKEVEAKKKESRREAIISEAKKLGLKVSETEE